MLEAWRLVRARFAAAAFTGEGAAKAGGRWNSRGFPVVYASAARSLAALETLVHLNPPIAFNYKCFRLQFAEELVERIELKKLPKDWQSQPPPRSVQRLGDAWIRSRRSAVLAVPSVLIPQEINYLLNPAHPDFKKFTIGKPSTFILDSRLVKVR